MTAVQDRSERHPLDWLLDGEVMPRPRVTSPLRDPDDIVTTTWTIEARPTGWVVRIAPGRWAAVIHGPEWDLEPGPHRDGYAACQAERPDLAWGLATSVAGAVKAVRRPRTYRTRREAIEVVADHSALHEIGWQDYAANSGSRWTEEVTA